MNQQEWIDQQWSFFRQMQSELKLTMELVPKRLVYQSMSYLMQPEEYKNLREQIFRHHEHRCGICYSSDGTYFHEVWEYDDENHTCTLTGFIALCRLCFGIKHFDYVNHRALDPKYNVLEFVQHFKEVNQRSEDDFIAYKNSAFFVWNQRNKFNWTQDTSSYKYLVEKSEVR